MDVLLIPWHLGALHPMETVAVAALALGPFVILAVVVAVVSRRDRRSEAHGSTDAKAAGDAAQAERREPADPARGAGTTTSDTAAPQSVQQ